MVADDELKTTDELAKKLKIKPKTLSEWLSAGKGPPFIRLGKVIRYRESDIKAWLDSQSENVE
jgi:excisionase family DNA binding protein